MFPDWTGKTVCVLGAGPSASEIAPAVAGRFPIIAVNLSYKLITPDDVLYAADCAFWRIHAGARAFPGLKICPDDRALDICPSIVPVEIPRTDGYHHKRMIRGPVGVIGTGGNGGFQAVNLAAQFGAKRILLAGLDYCGDHWHGAHAAPLWNAQPDSLRKWRDALDAEAETLASWGVEVVNISPVSTLRNYKRATWIPFSKNAKNGKGALSFLRYQA